MILNGLVRLFSILLWPVGLGFLLVDQTVIGNSIFAAGFTFMVVADLDVFVKAFLEKKKEKNTEREQATQ